MYTQIYKIYVREYQQQNDTHNLFILALYVQKAVLSYQQ